MKKWTLNSWTKFPAKHLPNYVDKKELDLVLSKIQKYPPLVFAGETRSLKKALAASSRRQSLSASRRRLCRKFCRISS